VRALCQVVPAPSAHGYPVILRGSLDIGKCLGSLGLGDAVDLPETRNGTADVTRIGERLFALAWKGESARGQAVANLAGIAHRLPCDVHATFIARMNYQRISEVLRV
jgi:hypothetical protein